MESIFAHAKACIEARDPDQKMALSRAAVRAWNDGRLSLEDACPPESIGDPGRPDRPVLVAPRDVPRRSPHTPGGRAALIHALTHIEFNAVNLHWDAVYRFRGMPRAYYDDWIRVADDEVRHFELLRDRLRELGHDYGDFAAHNGLWEMALKTAHDPMARMATVPRALEARALDAVPTILERLRSAGDTRTVELLEVILRDEEEHVAAGSRWLHYLCEQQGLDMEQTYRRLLERYMPGSALRGPLQRAARLRVGFSEAELRWLEQARDGGGPADGC